MQYGMRHLVGATLIATLCFIGQRTSAQEWVDASPDTYETHDTYGTYDTSGTLYDTSGTCVSTDGYGEVSCPAGAGGADHHACRSKACQGYRPYTEDSQPDLFYNYYVPNNMGAAAAAYPAPYPTPNLIGHTYYTYQPLMPHEFLYTHRRSYHQFYDGGRGLNRTTVRWYRTPVRTAFKDFGGSVGWFLGNLHR